MEMNEDRGKKIKMNKPAITKKKSEMRKLKKVAEEDMKMKRMKHRKCQLHHIHGRIRETNPF